MGKRGPKRTPTTILKRRGSAYVGQREEAGEPVFESILPQPPESLDAPAMEYWDKLITLLSKVPGLITEADALALGVFCQSLADADRFRAQCEAEGYNYTVVTREGETTWRAHPAASQLEAALARVKQYLPMFGLTPADRASISIPQSNKGPSKSDLIKPASTNTEADDAERSPSTE
jgi:P27 family predicted phage terminase small subunit